jgi:hypothetical protein
MKRHILLFWLSGAGILIADEMDQNDLAKGTPPFNGPDSDYSNGTHLSAAGGKKLANVRYNNLLPFLRKTEN